MAKKQLIRLTESDLHNIIKESVNNILTELDWRTYQSAAEKTKNPQQYEKFKQAANNSFNRQNGYGLKNIPYGDGKPNNNIADKDSNVYGGGNLSTYNGPQFVTTSGKVNGNGDEFSKYYTNQMVNRNGSNRGKMSDDEYDMPKSNHFNPALKMKQMSGDKQVRDYFNGKSKYVKGKGWQ